MGPPGSGKSVISECLKELLGKDKTYLLNLDETATFDGNLMEVFIGQVQSKYCKILQHDLCVVCDNWNICIYKSFE